MIRKAIHNGILVKFYNADCNHLENDAVRVVNNVHLDSSLQTSVPAFDIEAIVKGLRLIKGLDTERRGTYTSHAGFSSTLGQGWENPYPELDEMCGAFCVNLESLSPCQKT